jgi:hypothetical protein
MATAVFSDPLSGYAFTYKTSGTAATITAINNTQAKDKTSLSVPPKVGAILVTHMSAAIPPSVKTLRLVHGLFILPGGSPGCALTSVLIDASADARGLGATYESLPIAPGCHLSIGTAIKSIGATAFTKFTGTLTIPAGLAIASGAFTGCAFSSVAIVRGTSTTIGNCQKLPIASGCRLSIGEGITAIAADAFKNCINFTANLTFPTTLTSIGPYAFYGCAGLSGDLVLPKGLTQSSTFAIPEYAFYGCSGFTRLVLFENVTSIGPYAFHGCSGMKGELLLPKGRTATSTFAIPAYAFHGCSGFTKLALSENITSIGPYAFYGCSGLTGGLVLPKGRTDKSTFSIPAYAFYKCSGLTSLELSVNVTSIDKYAFSGCSGLQGVLAVPARVWNIADGAFAGCSRLTHISLPIGVSAIGASAFEGCSGLQGDLTLGGSVESIGVRAFAGCSGFSGLLAIHATRITTIPSGAFSGCANLTGSLRVPATVTSIGSAAFQGCSKLTGDLVIPASVKSVDTFAFAECAKLGPDLVLSRSLISIGSSAFMGCAGFARDLLIPNLVTSIGVDAFRDCGFTRLVAPDSLQIDASMSWSISTSPTGAESIQLSGSSHIAVEKYATKLVVQVDELTKDPSCYNNCERSHLDIPMGAPITPETFKGCRFNKVTIRPGSSRHVGPEFGGSLSACLFDACTLTIEPGIESIRSHAFLKCGKFGGVLRVNNTDTIAIHASAISACNFSSMSTRARVEYILKD